MKKQREKKEKERSSKWRRLLMHEMVKENERKNNKNGWLHQMKWRGEKNGLLFSRVSLNLTSCHIYLFLFILDLVHKIHT